jgi:hypothetical protein
MLTLILLCLAGLGTPAFAGDRVFAPDSFWYRPIPEDAPLHPNSTNYAALTHGRVDLYGPDQL